MPDEVGAVKPTVSVRRWPGAMSAPMGVRVPSHTIARPLASKMWNARFTGLAPVPLQVWLPVFVTVTFTVLDSAQYASIDAGSA